MKSYTDIEQSRVLAKILPIESADVFYENGNVSQPTFILHSYGHILSDDDIPAWSLAALLNILPKVEGFKPLIDLDINQIRYEGLIREILVADSAELLDAVVEIIIKLHEQKLI